MSGAEIVGAGLVAAGAAKQIYNTGKTARRVYKRVKKEGVKKTIKKTVKNQVNRKIRQVKIAKSTAVLASRLANPINQAKFIRQGLKGKGWILPGSKYIGPGNDMDLGKPVDKDDAAAYEHDKEYDRYLKMGYKKKDVYLGYSDADERLLKKTDYTTPGGIAIQLGIGAKKKLNKFGLNKRIRDSDVPPNQRKKSIK